MNSRNAHLAFDVSEPGILAPGIIVVIEPEKHSRAHLNALVDPSERLIHVSQSFVKHRDSKSIAMPVILFPARQGFFKSFSLQALPARGRECLAVILNLLGRCALRGPGLYELF